MKQTSLNNRRPSQVSNSEQAYPESTVRSSNVTERRAIEVEPHSGSLQANSSSLKGDVFDRIKLPYQMSSHLAGFTNRADMNTKPFMGSHNVSVVDRQSFVSMDQVDSWDGTPEHMTKLRAKADAQVDALFAKGYLTPERQRSIESKWEQLANATFGFNTFNSKSPQRKKR